MCNCEYENMKKLLINDDDFKGTIFEKIGNLPDILKYVHKYCCYKFDTEVEYNVENKTDEYIDFDSLVDGIDYFN